MKRRVLILTLLAASMSAPVLAHATSHSSAPSAGTTDQTAALTEGEVRKVDKEAKKLTIRHGAIANLDMPPMTMVFQTQDPAMLDSVKIGDKVRFRAEKTGGAYVVTRIEPAK